MTSGWSRSPPAGCNGGPLIPRTIGIPCGRPMDTIWPSRPIATVHRPFSRAVDSSGEDRLVAAAAGPSAGRFPEDWSSGDRLVINQDTPNATTEIWLTDGVRHRGTTPVETSRTSDRRRTHFTGWALAGLRVRRIRHFRGVRVIARWIEQVPSLDRRRRPSAMARGRARAAVHRRGSSVDVCFRRARRHLQGRITQTTLCIVFDQGAQFLRGRLRARRGRIDLLAVPRKWQCTRSRHGHRRLAGGTSHRGQVSSRPAWIRRMT